MNIQDWLVRTKKEAEIPYQAQSIVIKDGINNVFC